MAIDEEQNVLEACALEELFGDHDILIDTADGHIERLIIRDYSVRPPTPLIKKRRV